MKKINDVTQDIFMIISVNGVETQAELDEVLLTVRTIVERQIEF